MQASAVARVGRTLTYFDHGCLSRLMRAGAAQIPQGQAAQAVLPGGARLPPSIVPSTLVTMNTRVLLESRGSDEPYEVILSYPQQADPALARVSVLSPLGAGLLGLSVGEAVSWRAFGKEHGARVLGILSCGEYAWGVMA